MLGLTVQVQVNALLSSKMELLNSLFKLMEELLLSMQSQQMTTLRSLATKEYVDQAAGVLNPPPARFTWKFKDQNLYTNEPMICSLVSLLALVLHLGVTPN